MSDAGPSLTEGEADLYDVAPESFIAARDELARRLRSEGDKAAAARVGKLRRPPLTTWALNQVARIDPHLIEEMLGAGAALKSAMERALDGDASGLRQAHGDDRAAMEAVVAAAVDRLAADGYNVTDAIRQRMAATLRAATVDPSVAADLTAGVLAGDRDAPGFGIDALAVPLSPAPEKAKSPPAPSPPAEAQPAAPPAESAGDDTAARRQEADRLAEEAARRAEEAQARRREADALAAVADRLESEARHAEQRASQAREKATQAQRQAAAAADAAAEAKRQADAAAEAV
ncbi:MAG TPA: hypothetical protein VHT75_05445 [Acidimicrobiales bacterium]|nr:hypothetical protein [Acidimicrobiales bacterium]